MYKLFQPVKSKFSLIILSLILIFSVQEIKVIKAQEKIVFTTNINLILEQAKESYRNNNYEESVELWQELVNFFRQEKNYLNQAMALTNLALIYQKLGEITLAEEAILQSLNLLEKEADSHEKLTIYAQTLDIKAYGEKNKGQWQNALETWQKSEVIYHQLKAEELLIRNLLNQAQTYKNLGLYKLSCQTFFKSLNINSKQCKISEQELTNLYTTTLSFQEINSLIGLANLWRQLGKLDVSEQVLTNLFNSNQNVSSSQEKLLFFNLANTQVAIANRYEYIGDSFQSQRYRKKALSNFEKASFTNNLIMKTKAKTNQLNLFIQTKDWEKANNIVLEIFPLISQLTVNNETIFIKNNLAKNLICLEQKKSQCFTY